MQVQDVQSSEFSFLVQIQPSDFVIMYVSKEIGNSFGENSCLPVDRWISSKRPRSGSGVDRSPGKIAAKQTKAFETD